MYNLVTNIPLSAPFAIGAFADEFVALSNCAGYSNKMGVEVEMRDDAGNVVCAYHRGVRVESEPVAPVAEPVVEPVAEPVAELEWDGGDGYVKRLKARLQAEADAAAIELAQLATTDADYAAVAKMSRMELVTEHIRINSEFRSWWSPSGGGARYVIAVKGRKFPIGNIYYAGKVERTKWGYKMEVEGALVNPDNFQTVVTRKRYEHTLKMADAVMLAVTAMGLLVELTLDYKLDRLSVWDNLHIVEVDSDEDIPLY